MPVTVVAPPPTSLTQIAGRLEPVLRDTLRVQRETWSAVDPDLAEPLAALELAVLGGGKRLRPAFAWWGWRCAGGDPDSSPAPAAIDRLGAALELLHAFALIHDDVMDGAATRRSVPTTHATFSHWHAAEDGRGETRRFGESVAILVGDLAHVQANLLMSDAAPATGALWHELQVELMLGQYLDVLHTATGDASDEQARRIARLKSGRYTIEQPLRLGASLPHQSPSHAAELERHLLGYGEPLGMAFQLRDDVLGVVGDPAITGKPVGDDLREGKSTVILALARQHGSVSQRALLDRVGDPRLTAHDVADLQQILVDTGALEAVDAEIETLTAAAIDAITTAPAPDDAVEALVELARFVAARGY